MFRLYLYLLLYLGTFKQLGPDDLVHVVKSIPNSRQQIKEVNMRRGVIYNSCY